MPVAVPTAVQSRLGNVLYVIVVVFLKGRPLMRRVGVAGILVAVCFCGGVIGFAKSWQTADQRDGGPVRLLPGYHHRRLPATDTMAGLISRPGGPQISYDIGSGAGNVAEAFAEDFPGVTLMRTDSPTAGPISSALDERPDKLVLSMPGATFTALNTKSRQDVAEVLLMLSTFQN